MPGIANVVGISVGIGTSGGWTLEKLKERYVSLGFGTLASFMLTTFTDSQWATINAHVDADVFSPTDLDIDQWLDTYQLAGMKYVVIYTQNHDGFCLWNTDTHVGANDPYSVEYSAWGIANGTPDIVGLLVAGCRSRGLVPYLYWSMWDAEWERLTGTDETTNAAGLIAYKKAQLSELLTNYGEIRAIWIDGWGWHIPYTDGTGVPYAEMYNYIKALQPNCLVVNNDHTHPAVRSDIDVFEIPYEYIGVGNTEYAEVYQSMRRDYKGTYDTTLTQNAIDYMTASEIKALINSCNTNGATFLLGTTPDNTGKLATAQKLILDSLSTAITIDISDTFTDTDDVRLEDHQMDNGLGWVESVGIWKIDTNKVYSSSVGGTTSHAITQTGYSDVDISIDLTFPTSNNYVGFITLRYKSSTEHWRAGFERDAGGTPYVFLTRYGTLKGANVNITQDDGVPNTLRVTAHDETITIYWQGNQVKQETGCSEYKTETAHGIGVYRDASYANVEFDNFISIHV